MVSNTDIPLHELEGLGAKSILSLNEIGIFSKQDLEKLGPVNTYVKLKKECSSIKPSLNFLYALVGAIEGKHWTDIAKHEKTRLLMELEDLMDFE